MTQRFKGGQLDGAESGKVLRVCGGDGDVYVRALRKGCGADFLGLKVGENGSAIR